MLRTTLQTCEQGLLVVHAETFFAEEGVFKCVNVRDVNLLSRFELVVPMSGIGQGSEETVQEILVV